MFIFAEPYISNIAKDFISNADESRIVSTKFLEAQGCCPSSNFLNTQAARERLIAEDGRSLYINSENALVWLDEYLPEDHRLRKCIKVFKNKLIFRQTYAEYFPDINFKSASLDEVLKLKFDDSTKPFIIKPTVGFLSAGVYRVDNKEALKRVQSIILSEMTATEKIFPKSVLDGSSFILEDIIEGREFAIDAYYNDDNKPIIINILEHKFRDQEDMSDRLYITSSTIIKNWLQPLTEFFQTLQNEIDLRGFALHAEVRVGSDGIIKPIEVNPLRFAGWCTTDLCYFAYGINPYEYFAHKREPDWSSITSRNDNKVYGMSVISNNSVSSIGTFDYTKLATKFSDLKELRKIDYTKFPLMGFAFFSIDEDDTEFTDWILNTDFSEFSKT